MKKTKVSHLTKDMALILFFATAIPAVIGLSVMTYHFRTANDLQKLESIRIQEQISQQLSFLLKNIQASMGGMAQSPELIDFILTPVNLKRFVENRIVGKFESLKTAVNVQYLVLDENGKALFSYPESRIRKMVISKDEVKIIKDEIRLHYPIQFDDQNLPNINAIKRGALIGIIKMSEVSGIFPQIREIKGTAIDNLEIITAKSVIVKFESILFYVLATFLIMILSILLGLRLAKRRVIDPIKHLSNEIFGKTASINSQFENRLVSDKSNELRVLKSSFEIYVKELGIAHEKVVETEKSKALAKIASQVAHDVRSPLSALNLITSSLTELSEDKRIILRDATSRINDIANNLLSRSKTLDQHMTVELLPALVDSIVSEKRVELRDNGNIRLHLDMANSFGLYSLIDSSQLKRMLSNLINNSIEAIDHSGSIIVKFRSTGSTNQILIEDTGKGISKEILGQIGQYGKSFGKNGNGMGVCHAIEMVKSWGGSIKYSSDEGIGTVVTINLMKHSPPSWFVEEISLKSQMVIVDDDQSIHDIWKQRLPKQNLLHFFNGGTLKNWLKTNTFPVDTFFLFDQEFLNHPDCGLDLIEQLNLSAKSILVTSHYEEKEVRERANKLGVKILPKGLSPWVPLHSGAAR